MSWRERANCRDTDVSAFFPEHRGVPAAAAALCASCEVKRECAAYAADHAMYGIWSGERLDDDRSAGDQLGLRGRRSA